MLSWIAYGYPLRFVQEPPHYEFENHPTYYEHTEFVKKETDKQLKLGRFVKVSEDYAKCIHPIHVDVNWKQKKREIDDMRLVNGYQAQVPFKMQGLKKDLPNILLPGDHLRIDDIKTAYYRCWMHPSTWPYMCFRTPQGRLRLK